MDKIVKKIVFAQVVVIALALVLSSCKKTNENDPEVNNDIETIKINPDYVTIDWENAVLQNCNDSIGYYEIKFSGDIPDFKVGSVIAVDADTVVYYVKISSLTTSGNVVSFNTTKVYLQDIFYDCEFTLSTSDNAKSDGIVFYPTTTITYNEDGSFNKIDSKNGKLSKGGFTQGLWNYEMNNDGEVLFSGNNYSIYMEKMNLNVGVDLSIKFSFGGLSMKPSQLSACVIGEMSTEQKVRCDISGECSYTPGCDLWKHNIFKPVSKTFFVGEPPVVIPVVITLNGDLYREVNVSANGEISEYAGFEDKADCEIGFQWERNTGMTPVSNCKNDFNLITPTIEGKGEITAKVCAFPRIRVILEGSIGPSIDIKPYLSTTLSGGFKNELLGTNNDFCAWSLCNDFGVDAACGLSLCFFGYELENYSTPIWNVIDKPLYKSPQKISFNSSTNQHVVPGTKTTVSFDVYDHNYVADNDVITPLPQFVKFEGDGVLSSEYDIAENGKVSVDWTPSAPSDVLYAKMYDIKGNVIAKDVFFEEPQAITGDYEKISPSSVRVQCLYANVPQGAEYGVELTWDNGSLSYQANDGDTVQMFEFVDLHSDVIYTYNAYILFEGKYYDGDMRSFYFDENNERECLIEMYHNTNGENWLNDNNWCSEKPLSEWYGITTDPNGHVIGISLNSNNLTGDFALSCLEYIYDIDISNNGLSSIYITNNYMPEIRLSNCIVNYGVIHVDATYVIVSDILEMGYIDGVCDSIKVVNCNFGETWLPLGGVNANCVTVDNCQMINCGVSSNILLFRNSVTSNTWYCNTEEKLVIENSRCSTICSGDFNDNTLLVLKNATLWRSNWDDESLITVTRTLYGRDWYSLFGGK